MWAWSRTASRYEVAVGKLDSLGRAVVHIIGPLHVGRLSAACSVAINSSSLFINLSPIQPKQI